MSIDPGDVSGDGSDRDRIIEAAYSCLVEPHAGAVSVAAVLTRAGLSTRAFYRHFASKDALFLAMLRGESDWLAQRLDQIADDFDGLPVDQLRAWVAQVFDLLRDPRRRMRAKVLDSDEVSAARGYRTARVQCQTDGERSLATILRRGLGQGAFPLTKPEQDAVAIAAVVGREMTRPGIGDEWEEVQAGVVDFALRAVGAQAACRECGCA
ncbi:AcrR family transcriptional regulator [Mycobacterium frederiksbergense]|uniref:AcrR family transcriptional regulator n=1 Tax=Mycolicibacterium frederiksbergense TaxID=117567 RepID=A0ABT6L431_9MYCO|nr:TetR/AcrR family transcriptional regulator [Mycolicibacterium frederiksbergense]MDH6197673.1 AcrR family transcriptional regulator [Mycolicibacterium frederiksbergense]